VNFYVLSVAAFTGLTYTLIEAPSNGWLSARTLGLGALSITLLALFVTWEARAAHPMLPLRLFRNPRFTGAGLSISVLFFALSGVVFLSSQIYQFVLGYSPLAAGVRALPSAAALVVFSPIGAALARRAGVRVPVTLGLAAVTAGLLIFARADRAVLAGAIVVAAGLVVAFRAFRPVRAAASAEVPAGADAEVPAPAEAPVLEAARG
jgi:hypothetical protein